MPVSMIDSPEIRSLGHLLDVNATRAELITSNLANIDTPGYRARDVNFAQAMQRAATDPMMEYASFTPAAHTVEGLATRPDGNNVSLEREGLLMAQTQLRFQTAVAVLKSEFHRIQLAINEGGQQQ